MILGRRSVRPAHGPVGRVAQVGLVEANRLGVVLGKLDDVNPSQFALAPLKFFFRQQPIRTGRHCAVRSDVLHRALQEGMPDRASANFGKSWQSRLTYARCGFGMPLSVCI